MKRSLKRTGHEKGVGTVNTGFGVRVDYVLRDPVAVAVNIVARPLDELRKDTGVLDTHLTLV